MRVHAVSLAILSLLVVSASPTLAQDSQNSLSDLKGDWQGGLSAPASLKSIMLVDPSRLSISHSVSMSYGMGGGYQSGESSVTGLYLSHLDYQISNPLHVWVDVGVGFQPSLSMDSEMGGPQVVLPGFGLHYQPSEHFRLDVIVQNPRYYNPYSPYRMWRR